jgi:RES domain-containing protein
MRVYRISKCEFINDLSGTGSSMYGGRWNSKGIYILYTAESPSLALLETVVHITTIAAATYCMICINLPDAPIEILTTADLPMGWEENPPAENLKGIGDDFIERGKSMAIKLPSAVMAEEHNILINPLHPQFKNHQVIYVKPLPLDPRLIH